MEECRVVEKVDVIPELFPGGAELCLPAAARTGEAAGEPAGEEQVDPSGATFEADPIDLPEL